MRKINQPPGRVIINQCPGIFWIAPEKPPAIIKILLS
jgi:hypothetical protein